MISYFNTYFNTYFAGYFGQIADTPAVFWQALGHAKVEKLEEKKRKLIRKRVKVEDAIKEPQRELSFKDVDLVALDNELKLKILAIDARISSIKAREKRRDEDELLLLTVF